MLTAGKSNMDFPLMNRGGTLFSKSWLNTHTTDHQQRREIRHTYSAPEGVRPDVCTTKQSTPKQMDTAQTLHLLTPILIMKL